MKNSSNKMISSEDIQEYHFAGDGVRPPMNVRAKSQVEALEIYKNSISTKTKNGYEGELDTSL